MGVRFVIGRAGSGKTHYCLDMIRSRLRANPVEGSKLIFLVPEQASQQMERAILLPPDGSEPIAAAHRAEVFSFRRLGERLLESAAGALQEPLSDVARIMVLRHVAAELSPQLRYYQRVQRHPGFLERLSATISELMQEGVSPAELISGSAVDDSRNPGSQRKCQDLALLYGAYLRFLGDTLYDPSQTLRLARGSLSRCDWLSGAEVWMDGFASLGGEEAATLVALAGIVRSLEIAVLLDPSQVVDPSPRALLRSIFSRTLRTYNELSTAISAAGVSIDPPLILNPTPPPRFGSSMGLAGLERTLFSAPQRPGMGDGSSEIPPEAPAISVVELPSRRVEVEYAVSLICQWTRSDPPKYRYRDIAVIVRNLEPYYDLVHSALEERSVACFIDRRRPVTHHPLVEFLRTVSRVAVDGMNLDPMRILLKSGLLPITRDAADELENYILAHGIAGQESWAGPDWTYQRLGARDQRGREPVAWETALQARVNDSRRAVFESLSHWFTFAAEPAGHSGTDWARGLSGLMERLNVPKTLAEWGRQARESGDLDQAGEHEQVWADIQKFLESMVVAFGDRHLHNTEMAEVLEAGLGSLSLGLVPPTMDQVLVGSIERTRHPDIKAAILLGFNEGVFPARIEEDTILNDDDRNQLIDAGVKVGLPSGQRLHDESMLLYIALTRAARELVVTYAGSDDRGAPLKPSPFLKDLLGACPGLTPVMVGEPRHDRTMWDIQNTADLRGRLTAEFRSRPRLEVDAVTARARWNELYQRSRAELAVDGVSPIAFRSLADMAEASLTEASVAHIHPGSLETSVSSLEGYAACPFKYFAEKMLNLRERSESSLEAVDVGKVHHTVLEEFARDLIARKSGLAQLSSDEMYGALRSACERAALRLGDGARLSTARDAYLLRRAGARLGRVLSVQKSAAAEGSPMPRAAELSFGMRDGGLPFLELHTPMGRTAHLRGFVDRVDLVELADEYLGVVIDYKNTRNKSLDFAATFHGLSLQLLAYLLVLADHGVSLAGRRIRAGGALYWSLGAQYHRVPHPNCVTDRETRLAGTFRPRGLINAEHLSKLNVGQEKSGWDEHLAVYIKADGEIGHVDKNDAVPDSAFQAMLEHTRRRMGELADGILDGKIAVRPYRMGKFSPCSWCQMNCVCRFESDLCDVQFLSTMKRTEVYERLGVGDGSAGGDHEE